MKDVRPIQKHLLSLSACPGCGGYRYLVARTRSKKNIELQVKCIQLGHRGNDKDGYEWRKSELQTYKTVSSIPYSMLDPHDKGNKASRDGDSLANSERELREVATRVVTKYLEERKLATKT